MGNDPYSEGMLRDSRVARLGLNGLVAIDTGPGVLLVMLTSCSVGTSSLNFLLAKTACLRCGEVDVVLTTGRMSLPIMLLEVNSDNGLRSLRFGDTPCAFFTFEFLRCKKDREASARELVEFSRSIGEDEELDRE